jgi:hypothetical protein
MAAVTSTLVALGGVGLSAAQAIKANKDMKKAASQYDLANKNLKAIKETNQFKGVQVPRLGFELAQQGQDQQTQQAIAALQGTGAEGIIGGIGQLVGAGNEAYLQQAAQANQTQFQRDMAQAEAGQGIEARRAEREYNIGINDAMDASMRRAQSEDTRNQAIGSAFSALGTAAGGIDKMVGLYGKKSAPTTSKTLTAKNQPKQIMTNVRGSGSVDPNIVIGDQSNNTGLAPSSYWGAFGG